MDILTNSIILALVGISLALVLFPLLRANTTLHPHRSGQTTEEYQARYQATLTAIKELMFDYEMGKMSTADYEMILNSAKSEAAQLRRKIDELAIDGVAEIDPILDTQIETLVAEYKSNNMNGSKRLNDQVKVEIARLRNATSSDIKRLTCPHCGKFCEVGDAFCAACGQSLNAVENNGHKNLCLECGYVLHPDDLFCAQCGVALTEDLASQQLEEAKL